ncbi:phospholipase A and acyltransferase 3-like [Lepidochelys kempii]|uniref:phospholipase A and acyltransferase 3-like n=1 Tax=Lepidochelys kempii TaxID=8472 RepID=UPI003C6F9757
MPLKGRKPRSGDLIEIDRGFYKHWCVYVGDDYIVHLTGASGLGARTLLPDWAMVGMLALPKGPDLLDRKWCSERVLDSPNFSHPSPWLLAATPEGTAVVKKQLLKRVVRNCNYWVNNKHDKTLNVYPVPRIIAQVNKRDGEKRTYQVLAENCEHFANEMRYNTAGNRAMDVGIGAEIAVIGFNILALFFGQR